MCYNTGIKYYLQWRASALECFAIQPTPFLPLSGVYLYDSNAETIDLKTVTSHYHALIVQWVELSPCFTNINNKHYGDVVHDNVDLQCGAFFHSTLWNQFLCSMLMANCLLRLLRVYLSASLTGPFLIDHVIQRLTRRPESTTQSFFWPILRLVTLL